MECSDDSVAKMREKFSVFFEQYSQNSNVCVFNKAKYDDLVKEVELAKMTDISLRSAIQKRRIKRYDVLEIDGVKKLISPVVKESEIKYFVFFEELFDIIHKSHINSTGHSRRDRMEEMLSRKYANVTRVFIVQYLKTCAICEKKKNFPKKGLVVKPLLFSEAHHRAQVDLIDMQSCSDGGFRYIMDYQDHLTKFCVVRALKTKRATEVAYNLIDIFCLLGAPAVLQVL